MGVIPVREYSLAEAWYRSHWDYNMNAFFVCAVIGFIWITYHFWRSGYSLRWTTPSETAREAYVPAHKREVQPPKTVHPWSYILPGLPWSLIVWLKWDGVTAFIFCTALTYILTHYGSGRTLSDIPWMVEKSFYDGGVMIAGLMLVGLSVGWTGYVRYLPAFMDTFKLAIVNFLPTNQLQFILWFCAIAPASIYRGPGHGGLGGPMYQSITFLAADGELGSLQMPAAWGAFVGVQSYYIWACPTIIYTVWTCSVTGSSPIDFPLKIGHWGWFMAVGCIIVASFYYAV
jgi:hypothetical protein